MSAESEMTSTGAAAAPGAGPVVVPAFGVNPFPGLRPFEPDESELFFGREDDIQDILSRLRRTRFLAVVGSSGCGKSSVVRAGLVASAQDGFMAEAGSPWRIAMMRPGDNPVAQLAAELNRPEALGGDDTQTDEHVALLQATLRRGPLGIIEAVREGELPRGARVLVLVDQFEELFRFARGTAKPPQEAAAERAANPAADGGAQRLNPQDEARAFVKLLLAAAESPGVQVYVVLTMRSEFLGQCAAFPGLPEAINRGLYLLPQMDREQMADAIREPIVAAGGEISNRLVNRLLNDLGNDADQLPILQHALMRLWALWLPDAARGPMDLSHYESVGKLQGSLSKHAEETYAELDPEQRKIAEKLFRLITDTTPDNQKIRRPMRLAEISELAAVGQERLVPVIEKFREPQRSFLMPPRAERLTPDTVIDISHESLIRQWERLRDWADLESRETKIYRRFVENVKAWDEEGRSGSGLYTGSRLVAAEEWRDDHPGRLTPVQLAFLKASRRAANSRRNLVLILLGLACAAALGFAVYSSQVNYEIKKRGEDAERERANAVMERANAEEAKGAAERANEQLNDYSTALFESFGNVRVPEGTEEFNRLVEESLSAYRALRELPASEEDLARRGRTLIRFFIKDKEDEKYVNAKIVEVALMKKGFPPVETESSSQRNVPINSVWAAPNKVPNDDVKAVAYVLIRAGFQIRFLGNYPVPSRVYRPTPVIRVGGDPDIITGRYGTVCRPLTVQEIKGAAEFPLCKKP